VQVPGNVGGETPSVKLLQQLYSFPIQLQEIPKLQAIPQLQPMGNSQVVNSLITQSHSGVLLQTARTFVHSDQCSEAVPVRILMDGGSERSYVTTSLKDKLRLCLKFLT